MGRGVNVLMIGGIVVLYGFPGGPKPDADNQHYQHRYNQLRLVHPTIPFESLKLGESH